MKSNFLILSAHFVKDTLFLFCKNIHFESWNIFLPFKKPKLFDNCNQGLRQKDLAERLFAKYKKCVFLLSVFQLETKRKYADLYRTYQFEVSATFKTSLQIDVKTPFFLCFNNSRREAQPNSLQALVDVSYKKHKCEYRLTLIEQMIVLFIDRTSHNKGYNTYSPLIRL